MWDEELVECVKCVCVCLGRRRRKGNERIGFGHHQSCGNMSVGHVSVFGLR